MGYFANAGQIVIQFVFGALIALIVLRVLLQWVRANFYNPICQFLYKATNPVLMPLRKVIPAWRNVDVAGIVLAWLATVLKLVLLYATLGTTLGLAGLAVLALADLVDFVLLLYIVLILVRVVLSFVGTDSYHPIVPLVIQLTEPVMKPIRRLLPDVGGIDFSPMVVLLAITLARVLVAKPLLDFGLTLAQR
ncbi:MAG TPA: YggT family protein [Rhodanobacteraceae bacterium]|nr:YggT family protein [Rhodanobacteraceae bacterium]